jgi:hypothetical protein
MRLSLSLLMLGGCADWPRFAHPVDDSDAVRYEAVAGGEFAWSQLAEGDADNDTPLTAPRGPLAVGSGYVIAGTLASTGFDAETTPAPLADPTCGSSGTRTAASGDYTGDVDSFQFRPLGDGTLCLVGTWSGAVTVDALAFPVDECGVPGPALGSPALGLGATGGAVSWTTPATADARVAVVLAGTTPGADAIPYRVGVSLVAADAACPDALPE